MRIWADWNVSLGPPWCCQNGEIYYQKACVFGDHEVCKQAHRQVIEFRTNSIKFCDLHMDTKKNSSMKWIISHQKCVWGRAQEVYRIQIQPESLESYPWFIWLWSSIFYFTRHLETSTCMFCEFLGAVSELQNLGCCSAHLAHCSVLISRYCDWAPNLRVLLECFQIKLDTLR